MTLTASVSASADTGRPAAATDATGTSAKLSDISPSLQRVFSRVNAIRAKRGLRPFRFNVCLTGYVAQPWAVRMAETGEFRHRTLGAMRSACPKNGWVGENIAYGYPTANSVVKAWMHSPGHRANILRPQFRRIGLGVSTDANGRLYWVQNFGGN